MPDHSPARIDAVVAATSAAADPFAASTGAERAALLRGLADALLRGLADALQAARDTLVAVAGAETALGAVQLNRVADR